MTHRSNSNNSSVYDQVLYSPNIDKSKQISRMENQSNSTYEVLADIIEGGRSIQMSTRHEREMVDRLN